MTHAAPIRFVRCGLRLLFVGKAFILHIIFLAAACRLGESLKDSKLEVIMAYLLKKRRGADVTLHHCR